MGYEMLRCTQHDKRVLSIPAAFWPTRPSARLSLRPVASLCGTPEQESSPQAGTMNSLTPTYCTISSSG